jgi:hypothetical protein
LPGLTKTFCGFESVEKLPFPKFQLYDTAPIDVLVKFTLYGAQPSLLTTVKPATGAWALATAVSKRNIQNIA